MIRSGGENIYPAEIEDVLIRHPAIKDVAVIGGQDPKYLEAVCAVVVKAEGTELTETDVIAYCKVHLASYKKPKKVVFVDHIPRTPSGKIQKYLLREQFGTVLLEEGKADQSSGCARSEDEAPDGAGHQPVHARRVLHDGAHRSGRPARRHAAGD
ncbi:hypothetical protein JCM14719A_22520 [Calditerricola satsumensis]|uniref:AMP-binding enzyme C-terminal domain-containing protein n=1 Tax=Calditerricola satsumensis TaxID=373054 RepID=A0A8J3BAH3_9BACI|nr:hypothetical protein GCM10007043_12160 [Calditerricola satsumensis]